MVAYVQRAPGFDAHADAYYASGYRDLDAFKAAIAGVDVKLFEAEDAGPSGGRALTQKERRRGKRGLMKWILESLREKPLDYFEFGVMECRSFNRAIEWTPNRAARFYGFDTFDGLPEPWVKERGAAVALGRAAGELKAANAPAVYDARATLFKGLFQDTLPDALDAAFPSGRDAHRPLFINIDSDLYSSALFALTSMHPLLRAGDHVYFDEFFDAMNEFAAFNDYIRAYNNKAWFVPIARSYDGMLFRVTPPAGSLPPAGVIDRRSTRYLERMKAYARARVSLLKPVEPGRP